MSDNERSSSSRQKRRTRNERRAKLRKFFRSPRGRALKKIAAGLVITGIGVAVLFMGVKMAGGTFRGLIPMQEFDSKEYVAETPVSDIVKIVVDDDRSTVRLERATDGVLRVKYCENENEGYMISESDGIFSFRHVRHSSAIIDLNISITRPDTEIVVYVPVRYTGSISLESENGDIIVSKIKGLKDGVIHCVSGNAKLSQCSFTGDLTVRAEEGEVCLEEVTSVNITARARMSITGTSVVTTRDVVFNSQRGGVKFDSVTALTFEIITAREGSVELGSVKGSQGRVETASGSITVGIHDDWNVTAKTTGEVSVPDARGKKSLSLQSLSGDITVSYVSEAK